MMCIVLAIVAWLLIGTINLFFISVLDEFGLIGGRVSVEGEIAVLGYVFGPIFTIGLFLFLISNYLSKVARKLAVETVKYIKFRSFLKKYWN